MTSIDMSYTLQDAMPSYLFSFDPRIRGLLALETELIYDSAGCSNDRLRLAIISVLADGPHETPAAALHSLNMIHQTPVTGALKTDLCRLLPHH